MNFYVQVILFLGSIIDYKTIYGCLKHIATDNKKPAEFPIGLLTSTNRDVWADAREKLSAAGNEALLKDIDGSIMLLAFDSEQAEELGSISRHYLHSDGTNR